MEIYLSGESLYGDDFDISGIEKWYEQEKEAYSGLINSYEKTYYYKYNNLNLLHGFNRIPSDARFSKVMGLGAAYGDEFAPVEDRIEDIYIVEPSDELVNKKQSGKTINYSKPAIDGSLAFPDNHFDLITCFGTLHHIPNVSYVFSELARVLKPGGYLLVREPVVTMGDWRNERPGLTKNERGIPIGIFEDLHKKNKLIVISKQFCFCMTSFLQRKIGRFFKKPLFEYKTYLYLDRILSIFFRFNLHYHPRKMVERIAPQNVFYVFTKK